MIYFVLLILGIIFCVVFNIIRVKEGGIKALLLKTLTSSLFVCCAAAATVRNLNSDNLVFALFVIVGLVFGLLGDIWLDLKWIYSKDNDVFTFSGFACFLIGHLVYISGMFSTYVDYSKPLYIIVPVALAVIIAMGMVLLEKPMKLNYGKFRVIVGVYSFILVLMAFLSGSLALMYGFECKTLVMLFIGGVFFLISDFILSGTYFGEGKRRPFDIVTNHATYYIAQFLIAGSLLFIGQKF